VLYRNRLSRIERKLDEILFILKFIARKEIIMSVELDVLTAQVKANTDLEASAVTLIQGLAAQIAGAANDPVKIQALSDQLKISATALAAAITANTSPPA
jgi:hypothetical protein